jgi:hypothetical protein
LIQLPFSSGGEELSIACPPWLDRIMCTPNILNVLFDKKEADLLIASGILSAAKEQAFCSRLGPVKANGNVTSVPVTENMEAP